MESKYVLITWFGEGYADCDIFEGSEVLALAKLRSHRATYKSFNKIGIRRGKWTLAVITKDDQSEPLKENDTVGILPTQEVNNCHHAIGGQFGKVVSVEDGFCNVYVDLIGEFRLANSSLRRLGS